MGLIALVGFVACALIFGFSVFFLYSLARRQIKNPVLRYTVIVPALILLIVMGWRFLNRQELSDQANMDRTVELDGKGCGWREYKTATDVDGIYFETLKENPAGSGDSFYLDIYSAVEYPGYKGEIYHVSRDTNPPLTLVQVPKRTFRYGFRTNKETLAGDIVREVQSIEDFETGNLLAEKRTYAFDKHDGPTGVMDIFLAFVKFHSQGCGWSGSAEDEKRFRRVLQPKPSVIGANAVVRSESDISKGDAKSDK
jgi:hypothetical protein